MGKLGKYVGLGLLATGLTVGGVYAHREGEKTRAHEREVANKAMAALGTISPEDQAVIDAYNAMQARWDAKVKEATGGEMDLNGIKLRLALSQLGDLSR